MTDEDLIQSAALRASITSWLKGNPGQHFVAEIAAAVGAEHGRTAHALKMLTKGKLINEHGAGLGRGHKIAYSSNGRYEVETVREPKAKRLIHTAKNTDIELVAYGIEIVIGKNPATGRLRITLEG